MAFRHLPGDTQEEIDRIDYLYYRGVLGALSHDWGSAKGTDEERREKEAKARLRRSIRGLEQKLKNHPVYSELLP